MDLFECSVCLSDLLDRSPRILSCLHTFCTECLQQLIQNKKINCPTCREVTELKTDDVKELKVNFNLRQMKEQMEGQKEKEQKEQSPCVKAKSLCQICHQNEALFKCKDCPHLLCDPCKKKHGDIEDFKTHFVFELCQNHEEGITHLCKQCVLPLCTRCMLLDHTEHKNHFLKYEKGIEELQNDAKGIQGKIKKEVAAADKNHDGMIAKYCKMTLVEDVCHEQKQNLTNTLRVEDEIFKKKVADLEAAYQDRKNHLEQRMKEADEILKEAEDQRKIFTNLTELYNKERNECTVVTASLSSLINNKSGFCDKYQKIKVKADQCLVDMKKVSQVEYKLPKLLEPPYVEMLKPVATNKVMNLKVNKTLLTINKTDQIEGKWAITFIGTDVLLATENKPYRVIRLDMQGRVVNWYYPQDTDKKVNGLFVYNNDVYMLQYNTITVVPHRNEKTIVYNLNIDSMWGILVKDKYTIIISQAKNPGNIYKYDTKTDKAVVVVGGLDRPNYMSMMKTKEGFKYIISVEAGHCIKVYNSAWELLHSFGCRGTGNGQFGQYSPMATTVTDMGTVLVADQGNHRISHFTIDGQFLSQVVTQDDGIELPIGLCYKRPYLWVTKYYGDNIKCLELSKTESTQYCYDWYFN